MCTYACVRECVRKCGHRRAQAGDAIGECSAHISSSRIHTHPHVLITHANALVCVAGWPQPKSRHSQQPIRTVQRVRDWRGVGFGGAWLRLWGRALTRCFSGEQLPIRWVCGNGVFVVLFAAVGRLIVRLAIFAGICRYSWSRSANAARISKVGEGEEHTPQTERERYTHG